MLLKIQKQLKEAVLQALDKLSIECKVDIKIEKPDILSMGDFSSNIAMVLAKQEKKNPVLLAEKIIPKIQTNEYIQKVEKAGSGFINFFLSKDFFSDFVNNEHLNINILKNKKFLVEHSSPNLFKPFHIGHLVNNSIGESLCRVFEASGSKVTKISYPSDKSLGISKTVWALKNKKKSESDFNILTFADAYVKGISAFEKNPEYKEQILKIDKDIYEEKGENFLFYKKGLEISKKYFLDITKKLGSNFDSFIFESETEKIGKEIVENNINKVFKKSEGAVIFEGSKYGLFDNVFINSKGMATYSGKDIGLLQKKFSLYNFDKSITIADVEQKGHFQVVKKAAGLIEKNWEKKSEYISHGRLGFSGNTKISSRYGNVPLAEELIKTVKEKIRQKTEKKDFEIKEREEIENRLSLASLKYTILKVSCGKNIIFDFQKSLALEGATASYINYALVRAISILEKTDENLTLKSVKKLDVNKFEQTLCVFDIEVKKVLDTYSPHYLANYLYEIATEFNTFYSQTKILDKTNEDYFYNLKLTKKFTKIMKKGLRMLGIEYIKKM